MHEFSLPETTSKRYRHAIHQTRNIVVKPKHLQIAIALTLAASPCLAESGYVNVIVEDPHHQPVRLVEIGLERAQAS